MTWDTIAARFTRLPARYQPLIDDMLTAIRDLRADPTPQCVAIDTHNATIRFAVAGSHRYVVVGWFKPGAYVVCLDGSAHVCADQQIVTLPGVVPAVRRYVERLRSEVARV